MISHIPRASKFRFENYWIDLPGFFDIVELHWHSNPYFANMAKTVNCRFKQLRVGLKNWSKEISQLNKIIHNCNWVLATLDGLEDQRRLSMVERNFRKIVKEHLQNMLQAKRIY